MKATAWPLTWRSLSKNRIWKPRRRTSPAVNTTGTAVCSCSAPVATSEELEKYRPDILRACEKAMAVVDPDLDFIRVDEEAFLACPEESIDYAVMERTADAVVVPMDAGWSDVGSPVVTVGDQRAYPGG